MFTSHLHHCTLHTACALFLLPCTTSAFSTCCHVETQNFQTILTNIKQHDFLIPSHPDMCRAVHLYIYPPMRHVMSHSEQVNPAITTSLLPTNYPLPTRTAAHTLPQFPSKYTNNAQHQHQNPKISPGALAHFWARDLA